jgi:hypothetical protein
MMTHYQETYFISLRNKIITMLRDVMVTDCADRALHALVAGSINSAVKVDLPMKVQEA